MCDNTVAINQIANDVKAVKRDVELIEKHLDKQNGRVFELEKSLNSVVKDVAIQQNKCILLSQFEGEHHKQFTVDIKENAANIKNNRDTIVEFAKKYGIQIAEITTLLGVITKMLGWW